MPLESCMILLDNSEYMRNGDYIPTRLEAQHDAANLLVNHKTQSNPESTVGVIAMSGTTGSGPGAGGTGAELLVSPTDDMGKILAALHGVPTRGAGDSASSGVDISASVQVASLALKHRRNKNGAQRVVVFVGSPLGNIESRTLQRAGKQLKKNNVAIDIVALGELEENEAKLQELVDAANGTGDGGERTCNLVTIPAGVLPSDVLVSSPIVGGGAGGGGGMPGSPGGAAAGGGGGSGGDAFAEYGGVDPNMDPELAMALRVSMEEERARQERAQAAQAAAAEESKDGEEAKEGGEGGGAEGMEVDADGKPAAEEGEGGGDAAAAAMAMGGGGDDDEDALLQQALAMSMAESMAPKEEEEEEDAAVKKDDEEDTKPAAGPAAASAAPMEMDEDAEMQMALAMSMQDDSATAGVSSGEAKAEFQDPQFVNQLLGNLPGVDPNDPAIQSALKNLKKDDDKDDDKKKDGDDK